MATLQTLTALLGVPRSVPPGAPVPPLIAMLQRMSASKESEPNATSPPGAAAAANGPAPVSAMKRRGSIRVDPSSSPDTSAFKPPPTAPPVVVRAGGLGTASGKKSILKQVSVNVIAPAPTSPHIPPATGTSAHSGHFAAGGASISGRSPLMAGFDARAVLDQAMAVRPRSTSVSALAHQAAEAAAAAASSGNASPASRAESSASTDDGNDREPLSHVGAVALFAMDMLQEIARVRAETRVHVDLRIGIHTGRVVGGIIGKTRPRYFIWGKETITANLMESTGLPGQVQVAEETALRLQKEGFLLAKYQTVDTRLGEVASGPGTTLATPSAATVSPATRPATHLMQTYLLRGFVTPDNHVITVADPPML